MRISLQGTFQTLVRVLAPIVMPPQSLAQDDTNASRIAQFRSLERYGSGHWAMSAKGQKQTFVTALMLGTGGVMAPLDGQSTRQRVTLAADCHFAASFCLSNGALFPWSTPNFVQPAICTQH